MKAFFLIATYFLCVACPLFGQTGTLEGSVLDEQAQPLVGAAVWIKGTNIGSAADANGHFQIPNAPAGNWVLQASAIGYKPFSKNIEVKKGETLSLDISMSEDALGLDEMVVTGTMQETYVSQSPIKIDVVPVRFLEKTISPTNIVEAMQLVNGVQEVTACGVCYTNSISINGLPGAYTAILLDGAPIYGNLASVYGLNGIPTTIIDRFEVIKGPSSTLYGSEAVAGVINIITKDPEGEPLVSADVMGTSHLESFGNISLAGKVGKFRGMAGINYAYINDFDDRNADGFGDGVNLDRLSFFTKWTMKRPSGKAFTIAGKYYYEDRRNGVEAFLKNRGYRTLRGSGDIYGESIYTKRGEVFGTYHFAQLEGLRLDYSMSYHDQDSYYGEQQYVATQAIAYTNLVWNKQLGRHSLLAGHTLRWNNYDDNTVATQVQTDGGIVNKADRQFIPGVFLQDEWALSNRVTLLGGARLDHYRGHGPIFAPRLNAKLKLSEWTTLRGNFGTGFRIVNLFTEDHAFVSGNKEIVIAEELRPESSYNVSFDLNHVYLLGKGEGSIDLNAYYTHFSNAIFPNYDEPGKIIYANTDGYALTKGLGISVNHRFSFPLGINLNANFQRTVEREGELLRAIPFAARWSGVLSANYEWKKKRLYFAYTVRVTGPMALPEVYDVDERGNLMNTPRPTVSAPFALHNVQLTKSLAKKPWQLYVGVQNLFAMMPQYSPLVGFNDPTATAGFSQYFDTSYAYAPLHGREVYVGVRLRWK